MFTQAEIKQQLKELLVQKRNGELDTDKNLLNLRNEHSWRNSVTYDSLERYVKHHDEEVYKFINNFINILNFWFYTSLLLFQIKLNTLALIIESKKSTLRFTSRELDIIILFLRINFKEKLEFVPVIKKVRITKSTIKIIQF